MDEKINNVGKKSAAQKRDQQETGSFMYLAPGRQSGILNINCQLSFFSVLPVSEMGSASLKKFARLEHDLNDKEVRQRL